MSGINDRELLDSYVRTGDEAAFAALIERYRARLYAFVYKTVGNEADSLDVCQKVFVQVFLNASGFEWRSSFKTWLYRIAVNASLNHIEARGREAVTVEDFESLGALAASTPPEELIKGERNRILKRAVDELPWKQRMTVVMRIYEDLSYSEIADTLECPLGTVKANMHHALASLRKKIGSDFGL
ncbi:MAG: sigma-70 family RNA polymerase sigma factor [Deltaproteobacteria bacterium]|nr:sigma-70 family RNA polymerase sigma factor [Deltaproteobacteria bacterium]